MEITAQDLLTKIGLLTVQKDMLEAQVASLQDANTKLAEDAKAKPRAKAR